MPRKERDWYPGATYHVMCRGIRRMAIFREEEDYEMFLLMVKLTMERLPFTLHSYCMMAEVPMPSREKFPCLIIGPITC